MRKVIILNYMFGCVEVVPIPNSLEDYNESIEEYLENIGYKMSQIDWMMSPKDGTPVFYDTEECPEYTL